MTDFNYFTEIPNPSNNPSVDAPNMQTNTNSAAQIWDVDHFGFQDNNGGKHDVIHIPLPQAVTPATGTLEWAEYTRLVTTSFGTFPEFCLKRQNTVAGASDIQMTTNIAINAVIQNGATFIPGGIILKWGNFFPFTDDDSQSGTITFSPAFPSACFIVLAQAAYPSTPPGSSGGSISIQTVTTNTSFNWTFNTGSSQFENGGFYWFAIGI
jgi:hypothetical protein